MPFQFHRRLFAFALNDLRELERLTKAHTAPIAHAQPFILSSGDPSQFDCASGTFDAPNYRTLL